MKAAMAERLCYLARTTKLLCWNLGATRHRMTLDKPLTAVCLGSHGWCILITCDIHRPLWLVSVYVELKWLSGGTLRQAGPELQLVMTVRKISSFRNCLRTAPYIARSGILSFFIVMNIIERSSLKFCTFLYIWFFFKWILKKTKYTKMWRISSYIFL
jgi:hypothetical protein